MKELYVIQHHKLEYPFDNWLNNTYQEAVKLSRGEISPNIAPDIEKRFIELGGNKRLKDYKYIVTSPILRAKESAVWLKTKLDIDTPPIELECLKEVRWDLSKYMTEAEFCTAIKVGKYNVFEQRIKSFLDDSAVDSITSISDRIEDFKRRIQEIDHDKIIVVTHSFFMKILFLVFVEDISCSKINSNDFKKRFPIKYMDGFKIRI